jgi:16S rRNA (guanine(966)-N(2))-methyltransferase RsmD
MRVIAGSARGRRLKSSGGRATRPTADRVKEAIFNILGSRVELNGISVLDLFAGSGALGIEALSRGASHAVFVEARREPLRALRDNLFTCGFTERSRILPLPTAEALRRLGREGLQFDGVLLDPPYGDDLVDRSLSQLLAAGIMGPGGWIVVEHHIDEPPAPGGLSYLTRTHRYGKSAVTALMTPKEPYVQS